MTDVNLFDELELGVVVIDPERRCVRMANRAGRAVLELRDDRLPPELDGIAFGRIGACLSFTTTRGERVFARTKRLQSGDLMLTIAKPRHDDHVMTLLRTSCQLSDRQAQVAGLLARGLSNRQIATRLGLALSTVKAYVTAVLAAVAVTSRSELIVALDQFR